MLQPTVILDACVLLNLLASSEAENIVRATAYEYLICDAVSKEAMHLRADSSEEEVFETAYVDSLIQSGLLTVCAIEVPLEESLYVNYAGRLGDGEAMSIAIAEVRGCKFATDDRKARRVFREAISDDNRLIFTSDLIRQWVKQENIASKRLKSALLNIRRRATFFPPKSDPNFDWWMGILDS